MTAQDDRISLWWVRAGLPILLLLLALPLYFGYISFMHDTSHHFRMYNFFYSELIGSGEVPSWFSYSGFGGEAYSTFTVYFSSSLVFTAALGCLLNVKDVSSLFITGLVLDQMVLLTGTLLLAKLLFRRLVTVLLVALSIILSTMFLQSFAANFAIYLYWPLIFWCIMAADKYARPSYLVAAGVVFVISQFGKPVFSIPMELLCFVTFSAAYFSLRYRNIAQVARGLGGERLRFIIFSVVLFAFALLYYTYISEARTFNAITAQARNADGSVDRSVFLAYGDTTWWKRLPALVYPMELAAHNRFTLAFSPFVGYLPLAFAMLGLKALRTPAGMAFAASFAALVLLAAGDLTPAAGLLYDYFPLMKYFRPIFFSLPGAKIIVIFLAGFGVDAFFDWIESEGRRKRVVLMAGLFIAAIALMHAFVCFIPVLKMSRVLYENFLPDPAAAAASRRLALSAYSYLGASAAFLLIGAALIARFLKGRFVEAFLLSSTLWLGISYYFLVYGAIVPAAFFHNQFLIDKSFMPAGSDHETRLARFDEAWRRERRTWTHRASMTRGLMPPERLRADILLINFLGETYERDFNYLRSDTCMPYTSLALSYPRRPRFNTLNPNVLMLLSELGVSIDDGRIAIDKPGPDGEEVRRVLACGEPKFRLHAGAVNKPLRDIRREDLLSGKLYVSGEAGSAQGVDSAAGMDGGLGHVEMLDQSANSVRLRVRVDSSSAWLEYADAWDPHWRAYIDGAEAPVATANMAFKAVYVPQGEHVVSFRYANTRLDLIRYIFIVADILIVLGILAVYARMDLRPAIR